MRLIKANLHNLNAAQMADKGDYVVSKMQGNASFPAPAPTMPVVIAAIAKLRTTITSAQSGAHDAIIARNLATTALRLLLAALALYVNSTSGSDLNMALSSGFEQVQKPQPVTLEAPVKVRAKVSAFQNCVDMGWKSVPGALMYQVYIAEGDPATATWAKAGTSSRAGLRVGGLVSGKLYSLRVAALGAAGEGPISEIVSSRAA